MTTKGFTVKDLMWIAMFAAITAVLSQIAVPLPFTPIPINLATFSVFIAGGLLGAERGAVSQLVYVLLGAAGVPVFANFTGGFARLAGSTGGYIAGYILAAFIIGLIIKKMPKTVFSYAFAMIVGAICYFSLGTVWFMFVMESKLLPALTMCVFPYIPGDLIKVGLAAFLVKRLEGRLNPAVDARRP